MEKFTEVSQQWKKNAATIAELSARIEDLTNTLELDSSQLLQRVIQDRKQILQLQVVVKQYEQSLELVLEKWKRSVTEGQEHKLAAQRRMERDLMELQNENEFLKQENMRLLRDLTKIDPRLESLVLSSTKLVREFLKEQEEDEQEQIISRLAKENETLKQLIFKN